jgi:RNA polymerase sigma factor (sigma-70 family)
LYESAYPDLLRFVQRRTEPASAEDVVAETFLVVWKRFSEAPAKESDARAWLFGVARNLLLNAHRGEQRRQALGVRLAETTTDAFSASHADLVSHRIDLSRAWQLLSEVHQEALGLAVFENLASPQAAKVDTLLRTMDAAEQSSPPDPNRAQADLIRVLSSQPVIASSSTMRSSHHPNKPKIHRRRALTLAGLAAAVTAGFVIMPALSGGDPAFATWTAAPGTLTGSERDNAVSDCRNSKQNVGGGMYSAELSASEVAIAERRGAWVTIVLSGADGFEATCTTDATAAWFRKGMIGSIGKPADVTVLPARGIAATQLGTGTIADNPISIASGRVGTDVTGVSYTNAEKEEVVATVAKGQFAFWLPGNELQNATDQGVRVHVTYSDGSSDLQLLNF